MSVDAAIRVEGVSKLYGSFVAVGDLSFEVPRGVIYGLLGPNGAGKTTTLRMVNDILAPDRGEITILDGLKPGREALRRIGYLPEERGLYPKMRVIELLQFFGELRGLGRKNARGRAHEWLERLGVADWAPKNVQDLSKGMQQKVQFITALMHEPELLILDEPWSGLDPINAEVLREVVLEQRDSGRTVVFSTHLMEQAEQICDYVCIIARGHKALEGELASIKREHSTGRRYAIEFSSAEAAEGGRRALTSDSLEPLAGNGDATVLVDLPEGDSASRLLRTLLNGGVEPRRFELVEPSLHEIFVERVGDEAGTEVSGREVGAQ